MDLKNLDLGAAAEEGVKIVLRMPPMNQAEELDKDFEGDVLTGPSSEQLIVSADGEEKPAEEPMYIIAAGKDSKTFKAAFRKVERKIGRLGEKQLKDYRLGDEPEEDAVAALASVTLGGRIYYGDEWVDLNKDNVAKFYKEMPFVRSQVDRGITDRSLLNVDFKKN